MKYEVLEMRRGLKGSHQVWTRIQADRDWSEKVETKANPRNDRLGRLEGFSRLFRSESASGVADEERRTTAKTLGE